MTTIQAASGVVRTWDDDEGWGVIDSDATPGGCWAHFSVIEMPGYRSLAVGDRVELDVEAASYEGYDFMATRVRPDGAPTTDPEASDPASPDEEPTSPDEEPTDVHEEMDDEVAAYENLLTFSADEPLAGMSEWVVPLFIRYDAEADAAYLQVAAIEDGGVARTVSVDVDLDSGEDGDVDSGVNSGVNSDVNDGDGIDDDDNADGGNGGTFNLDLDARGHLIGLEVLNASALLDPSILGRPTGSGDLIQIAIDPHADDEP